GQKYVARLQGARIRAQAALRRNLAQPGANRFRIAQGRRCAHMLSSGASGEIRMLVTDESGATFMARKAFAVIAANTGAATRPPKWPPTLGSSTITATTMRGFDTGA